MDFVPRSRFGTMLANAAAGYFCGAQDGPAIRHEGAER